MGVDRVSDVLYSVKVLVYWCGGAQSTPFTPPPGQLVQLQLGQQVREAEAALACPTLFRMQLLPVKKQFLKPTPLFPSSQVELSAKAKEAELDMRMLSLESQIHWLTE